MVHALEGFALHEPVQLHPVESAELPEDKAAALLREGSAVEADRILDAHGYRYRVEDSLWLPSTTSNHGNGKAVFVSPPHYVPPFA